jgi:filamentous hemagglutinin
MGSVPNSDYQGTQWGGQGLINAAFNTDAIGQAWDELNHPDFSSGAGIATFGVAGISLGANVVNAAGNVLTIGELGVAENGVATGVKGIIAAAEGGAYSAIGSTGQVGEQWLAQNLGGESQVFFNTTQGGRYVDQLVGDIANESKVGYQSLTPSIQLQISKDAELLNGGTFQSVNWHFFQSPVTGLGGPSQPLMNALQQNGINVIIH